MRKINAIVDLNLTPLPDSERGAGEIAEAIDRNAGGFVEPGYEIGRSEMREVMLDMMHFGFDLNPVIRLERFLDRSGAANVFDFLRDQFRMRPMGQNESEPAQIVHARFAIDRDVIDLA